MSVAFCHPGSSSSASYRYRCLLPAKWLGAKVNDTSADVMVCCKPNKLDIPYTLKAKEEGRKVVMDFCDMHFDLDYYVELLKLADVVTCASEWLAQYVREEYGIDAIAIPDSYEMPKMEPHCKGNRLLWFGHPLNAYSLKRVMHQIEGNPLHVISGFEGSEPWTMGGVHRALKNADMVVMPETAPYKSSNRTLEAIRMGCFVVAEPHPAIEKIPGIWIGNIGKGVEWAKANPDEANARTLLAQQHIEEFYSAKPLTDLWSKAVGISQ